MNYKRFRPYEPDKSLPLPQNLNDRPTEGHIAFLVRDVVVLPLRVREPPAPGEAQAAPEAGAFGAEERPAEPLPGVVSLASLPSRRDNP